MRELSGTGQRDDGGQIGEGEKAVVVLGVSELVERVRDTLDVEFERVVVEGEIGSLHRSRPGHCYFDLKDADAQLRCVMFRAAAERLPFALEEGLQVRVQARFDIYPPRGTLQLVVQAVEPAGEGALRLAFERLKQRLFEEGLFAAECKQPLPFLPARIGLVTSIQGAALHDFVRGLRRRSASLEVVVFDARVQGELAWRDIARGLQLLDADPSISVIVLARGGGSLEDLWSFNREELVRAIAAATTPVVSAIGHEVDQVLTDLVADARAATPTSAAELVAPDASQLLARVEQLEQRLLASQRSVLARARQRVELTRRGLVHPSERLRSAAERIRELRSRLGSSWSRQRSSRETELAGRAAALPRALRGRLERSSARLGSTAGRLSALSPLAVLDRGYALARSVETGAILRASREAPVGSELDLRLARGALRATVSSHREDE